jgi:hypothetical protein
MTEEAGNDKSKPIANNDPGGPKLNAGSFISPKTKQRVYVFRKNGESNADAWLRVRNAHGLHQ